MLEIYRELSGSVVEGSILQYSGPWLSYHTELSQHHICTKGTPQALFVLVGADWVMELGSASSY